MDQKNAVKLLDNTFNQDFDLERFSVFIKELFNHFNLRINENIPLRKEYYDYITQMDSLGVYSDSNGDSIEVFTVQLEETSSRDRARTMQRNLIAKYLKNSGSNAALVAFYGDDPQDWRFSFVKIEYDLVKDEKGNLKVQEDITPAKRYSFLVGKNEPNHTCRRQFVNLIIDEKTDPLLEQIEEAFSIENVTKEFFEEYKKLFLKLQESLELVIKNDSVVKVEFEKKRIPTVDFAKKLMGQIVFIYFLQKKGWLGVQKDNKWGNGPRNFLRELFNRKNYENFFNDILEPLFYEALATPRDNDYYRLFDCKIPFLNGGLFEPINEYDWVKTDITLTNKIFEDILDVFDLYNFTIKEDEPLEKEVAVDPEMLGKVFENLLDVKDRKSQGAFYTPREIVHYMCQEGLINYLQTNLELPKEDIKNFILLGDFALDILIREIIEFGKLREDREYGIPKSIKENYKQLDTLLREIKVVDPAVGSGAFPVGMMNEIVKARSILSFLSGEEKSNYQLKLETIRDCLYGVDIDSSAVDIAKLRFWLSLIVDEEDINQIDPLPNLDHKIMCGNSLLEDFDGKKLFDEKLLMKIPEDFSEDMKRIQDEINALHKELGEILTGKTPDENKKHEIKKEIKKLKLKKKNFKKTPDDVTEQFTLDQDFNRRVKESQLKLKELKNLQKLFFEEQNSKLKRKYREQIDKIEWELIEETLNEEGNANALSKLSEYKKNKSKPFFLWKLYFPEVYQRDKPGFDIVIANPPYVENKKIKVTDKKLYKNKFVSAYKLYDLSILFIEKSIDLLRENGFMVFINTNKFLASDYGIKIRQLLMENVSIKKLIDVSYIRVFKEAAAFPIIISYVKQKNNENKLTIYPKIDDIKVFEIGLGNGSIIYQEDYRITPNLIFNVSNNLKLYVKISKSDGIKKLGDLEHKFIYRPLGFTNWNTKLKNLRNTPAKNSLKFISTPNIFKYHVNWNKRISVSKQRIEKAYMDYNPDFSKKWNELKKEQILVKEISLKLTAAYSSGEYCHLTGIYGLNVYDVDNKYILAILNSKLMNFYYNSYYGLIHLTGGYLKINSSYLKTMPIKIVPQNQQIPIISVVDEILSITKDDEYLNNPEKISNVGKLEKKIDLLVYKVYELNQDEINIIENFNNSN